MRKLILTAFLPFIGLVLLSGCASQPSELIVVLPHEDGSVGGVEVDNGSNKVLLDQPYAAMHTGNTDGQSFETNQKDVDAIFSSVLDAQPIPPKSFTLYFKSGTTNLMKASEPEFLNIFSDIAKREAAEVMVIGHTDRVGSVIENDQLALKRAQTIMVLLIDKGILPEAMKAVGRGEREPLVQTEDGVDETKNRRVEINIR